MAKDTVDRVVELLELRGDAAFDGRTITGCRTKHRPLPGAQGLLAPGTKGVAQVARRLEETGAVTTRVAQHLAEAYGNRADGVLARGNDDPSLLQRIDPELPYLWAEVEHAVAVDLARTVEDVLVRRIPLCLRGRDQGLGAAERVADRLAAHLGWSPDERAGHLADYRSYVASTRRFRNA